MTVIIDTISKERPRHPEKAHRPDSPLLRKPDWIRVKAPVSRGFAATRPSCAKTSLSPSARKPGCPNIGDCWEKKHATFMIMGDTCTRACAFCNVKTGLPGALDADEPDHVAQAVAKLGLAHVVDYLGRPRRPRRRRRRPFRAHHPRHPRALPRDHDRNADARFPAQGRRARKSGRRPSRTCSTTISKRCRRAI